jgi:hypothetical protein
VNRLGSRQLKSNSGPFSKGEFPHEILTHLLKKRGRGDFSRGRRGKFCSGEEIHHQFGYQLWLIVLYLMAGVGHIVKLDVGQHCFQLPAQRHRGKAVILPPDANGRDRRSAMIDFLLEPCWCVNWKWLCPKLSCLVSASPPASSPLRRSYLPVHRRLCVCRAPREYRGRRHRTVRRLCRRGAESSSRLRRNPW